MTTHAHMLPITLKTAYAASCEVCGKDLNPGETYHVIEAHTLARQYGQIDGTDVWFCGVECIGRFRRAAQRSQVGFAKLRVAASLVEIMARTLAHDEGAEGAQQGVERREGAEGAQLPLDALRTIAADAGSAWSRHYELPEHIEASFGHLPQRALEAQVRNIQAAQIADLERKVSEQEQIIAKLTKERDALLMTVMSHLGE